MVRQLAREEVAKSDYIGCLVSSSGLAENPHESDNGNYGHNDDDDQACSVQSF